MMTLQMAQKLNLVAEQTNETDEKGLTNVVKNVIKNVNGWVWMAIVLVLLLIVVIAGVIYWKKR